MRKLLTAEALHKSQPWDSERPYYNKLEVVGKKSFLLVKLQTSRS